MINWSKTTSSSSRSLSSNSSLSGSSRSETRSVSSVSGGRSGRGISRSGRGVRHTSSESISSSNRISNSKSIGSGVSKSKTVSFSSSHIFNTIDGAFGKNPVMTVLGFLICFVLVFKVMQYGLVSQELGHSIYTPEMTYEQFNFTSYGAQYFDLEGLLENVTSITDKYFSGFYKQFSRDTFINFFKLVKFRTGSKFIDTYLGTALNIIISPFTIVYRVVEFLYSLVCCIADLIMFIMAL